ncbi:MAG: hypothetical protein H5T86_14085 [Armatimonadetes bacterium]|nr:hypothetical protein [Armatimonadota bacterium]
MSNDAASELAALAALAAVFNLLRSGPATGQAFRAGLWIGLAMLVKSSTLPLLVVGLVATYLAWKRAAASEHVFLAMGGAMVGGFLLVWGWWGLRNTLLYGDPLAARAFQRIFGQDRATPEFFISRGLSGVQYYMLVGLQTAKSFWGVLGQANVFCPRVVYVLGAMWWAATAVLALCRGIASLAGRCGDKVRQTGRPGAREVQHQGSGRRPIRAEGRPISDPGPWVVLGSHLFLTLALFLRFNAVFYQAQARYFLPASCSIGVFLAWPWGGLNGWIGRVGLAWYLCLALAPPVLHALGLTTVS